jgi:hypothetical protein
VSSLLIGFFAVSNTIDNIVEGNLTCDFSNDNVVEWIPCADEISLGHFLAISDSKYGTIRNVVGDHYAVVLHIHDPHFSGTTDNNLDIFSFVVFGLNSTESVELHFTIKFGDEV